MRRAFAALLLLVAATAAAAQNANEDAKRLAQRLGSERSVEGLQTIVDARNRELLEWYERGWRDTSQREGAQGGQPTRGDRLGFADSKALLEARDRFAREHRVTFTPLPPRQ